MFTVIISEGLALGVSGSLVSIDALSSVYLVLQYICLPTIIIPSSNIHIHTTYYTEAVRLL